MEEILELENHPPVPHTPPETPPKKLGSRKIVMPKIVFKIIYILDLRVSSFVFLGVERPEKLQVKLQD